jgi:hypothetical protein
MKSRSRLEKAFILLELTSCVSAIDESETDGQPRYARRRYLRVQCENPEIAADHDHGFTEESV